jgi:hypothetical protein
MKYLLMICVEEGLELSPAEGEAMGRATESWVAEMDGRGVRLQGNRLRPVSDATTATTSSSARTSTRPSRWPRSTPSPASAPSR